MDKRHRYFGYPNAWAVEKASSCCKRSSGCAPADTVFANRSRPCLLYQIKRCSGPCVDDLAEAYALDVRNAEAMLRGETQELLRQALMEHAGRMEYEQAAEVRNQMTALSRVLHQQVIETADDRDVDILAVKVQGSRACVNRPWSRRPPPGRPAVLSRQLGDAASVYAGEKR